MSKDSGLPKWPVRMLEWLCADEHLDMILGDLEELYMLRLEQKGKFWSKLHFIKDSFDMIRPFAFKKKRSKLKSNTTTMLKNYFKISLRSMIRHKAYAAINLLGLSIGIACFTLIFLYVNDELSYDRYHEHANEIYRVYVEDLDNGEVSRLFNYVSPMHGKVLRDEYPQVVASVRFYSWNPPLVEYKDKQFSERHFGFTEPSVFDVFSFQLLEGSKGALDEPNAVVITKSTRARYFGEQQALGKTLQVVDGDRTIDFKVTAVVEDFPEQSHISYDFMASWSTYERLVPPESLIQYSGNYNYPTYIRLENRANIESLQGQMPSMLSKYIDNIDGNDPNDEVRIGFQKLTDIHLKKAAGSGGVDNAFYVRIFSGIGLLVLAIACINYMNLATAKYSNRLKEIGVRKVMGALRGNISRQFLVESIFYTLVSLFVGLIIAAMSLNWVNEFAGKSLSLNPVENSTLLVFLLALILVVGFLAGSYPALFMSKFSIVNALKNEKAQVSKRSIFKTSMVVLQFSITIGLILGVIVVDRQIDFIRNQDIGYDREQVVNFWASPAMNNRLESFKAELLQNPNVVQVATSSRIPTGRLADALRAEVFDDQVGKIDFRFPFIRVDEDFLDVYDIDVVAGEGLTSKLSDSTQRFMINETAVRKMGWNNPEQAIGKKIHYGWLEGFIQGVVKDFHFESLHFEIMPIIFVHDVGRNREMSVKISGQNIPETMAFLESKFKEANPDRDFNAVFVDDLFNSQYQTEQRLSEISKLFSILAIFIASLGLLGLVAFSLEQRSKEISIRKVLGASVPTILLLVNKRYAWLILIAFLVSTPIAFYMLNSWLNSFAYHINVGVGLIFLSGLIAFVIAMLTISSQVFKFASGNPIKWLTRE